MKNTLENQIAFKSQYFAYLIGKAKDKEKIEGVSGYSVELRQPKFNLEIDCFKPIELKNISEITDEDMSILYIDGAIKVDEFGYYDSKGKVSLWSGSDSDYLRNKGFLICWGEIQAKDAIDFGWVKFENTCNE